MTTCRPCFRMFLWGHFLRNFFCVLVFVFLCTSSVRAISVLLYHTTSFAAMGFPFFLFGVKKMCVLANFACLVDSVFQ